MKVDISFFYLTGAIVVNWSMDVISVAIVDLSVVWTGNGVVGVVWIIIGVVTVSPNVDTTVVVVVVAIVIVSVDKSDSAVVPMDEGVVVVVVSIDVGRAVVLSVIDHVVAVWTGTDVVAVETPVIGSSSRKVI